MSVEQLGDRRLGVTGLERREISKLRADVGPQSRPDNILLQLIPQVPGTVSHSDCSDGAE